MKHLATWKRERILRAERYPDAVMNSTHSDIDRFRPSDSFRTAQPVLGEPKSV